MSKGEYLKYLLKGKIGSITLTNAALLFWHSQVPCNDAREYITNLESKLNEKNRVSRRSNGACIS